MSNVNIVNMQFLQSWHLNQAFNNHLMIRFSAGKEAAQSVKFEEVAALSDYYDSPLLFADVEVRNLPTASLSWSVEISYK